MGDWLTPVAGGLIAGVAVAVLAYLCRGAAPKWTGGGRLAVLLVVAIALGAGTPLLLRQSGDAHPVEQDDGGFTDTVARLRSADLDERVAAVGALDRLAQYSFAKLPKIIEVLAEFVRGRAPKADDPGCADSVPAEDVDAALAVLRARPHEYDVDAPIDLHGTCLAGADLRGLRAPGGKFGDVNLTGASLKSAELTGADLARAILDGASLKGAALIDTRLVDARFAGTDVTGAQFSDDTLWPPRHEDAVLAASSFATTNFVIDELVLSDPR